MNTSWSFFRSWFITGFVTRLTRWVSLVEQKLLIFSEHLCSPRFWGGSCYLIFNCICMFCRFYLSFCTFSFGPCVLCSSIYGFWLPFCRTDHTMAKTKKDQQRSIKHYTENWRSRNTSPTKSWSELMCFARVSISCSTCSTRHVTVKRCEHHVIWKSCWTSAYVNKYNWHN